MEQTFEYLPTSVYIEKINIKDIGNCIIEAKKETPVYYYLTIQTELGITRICEFGPCIEGCQYEIKSFKFNFNKFEYSESKIIKAINTFLKNPTYEIVEAKEITLEELYKNNRLDILKFVKGDYND